MNHTPLSIAGLALGLAVLSAPCDARNLRLEDYLDLENVSAPKISPDGKTILYSRAWVNVPQDRYENELWAMDADGGHNRRLMKGGGDVQWSPDGTRIAYIDATDRGPEIFVRWMDASGNTAQVTHAGIKPEGLSWSPDGKWIAFMGKVPAPQKWTIALPERPPGAKWTEDATVIDKLHYRMDHIGHTFGTFSHIFVVPAEGGTPKQVTHGEWHAEPRIAGMPFFRGSLEWTADGKSILFSADKDSDSDTQFGRSSLHIVDVADGRIRTLTKAEGFWALAPGPRISPDGKRVAYVGTQASNTSNYPSLELHVIGIDGSADRTLIADLPGRIGGFLEWSKNGQTLSYVVGKDGANNIFSVSMSGEVKPLTTGAQSFVLSSLSNDGVAAGTLTSAYKPPDVVRLNIKDGRDLRTLTAVNEDVLGGVELGRVEEIWYTSTDSTRVQGWIVYPPDFSPGRKYPLILDIHGGPEYMYESSFRFTFQDMAAQGYVVLYTNPRGSTGYGGEFTRAIYNAYPGRADFEDLMHGVDTVTGRGFIDNERMYVQGCSGGGILTAWTVTQTDRFAGAAALCTVVDWIAFGGSGDIPQWIFNRYKKPFWEDPGAWLATSSIMQINKVKTPTLVMVGEKDIRTPVPQSEELFTGLKMMNVPTRLILFKDEWHGTYGKPSNMLRTQLYLRKWYGEWRRVMEGSKPVWRNVEQTGNK